MQLYQNYGGKPKKKCRYASVPTRVFNFILQSTNFKIDAHTPTAWGIQGFAGILAAYFTTYRGCIGAVGRATNLRGLAILIA